MRPIRSLSLLAPLFTLAACGLDPSKIAAHTLLADDGARLERTDSVQFAVVGNPAGEGTPPNRGVARGFLDSPGGAK